MKRYPIGTKVKSLSHRNLTGKIIGYSEDDHEANIVEWHDGVRPDWTNHWYDSNFDNDSDKVLTIPVYLDEDLFTL